MAGAGCLRSVLFWLDSSFWVFGSIGRPVDRSDWKALLAGGASSPGSARRLYGGLVGGLCWSGAGLLVAGTVWVAPGTVNRARTLVFCAVAVAVGAVLLVLPWARWPTSVLAAIPVAGVLFLGLWWWVVPHTAVIYFPLVMLAYFHTGLMQRPGAGLGLVPLTTAAVLAGTRSWSVSFLLVTVLGVGIAEGLARIATREAATNADLAALLDATSALADAATVEDAAAILKTAVTSMLHADMVLVYTPDPLESSVYLNRSPDDRHGPLQVNVAAETSGVGHVVRSGEALFVVDASRSPVVSQRLVTATGVHTLLYLPLTSQGHNVGVVTIGWNHGRGHLDRTVTRVVDVLTTETARVMERLDRTRQLTTKTLTDALTGIGNRRAWDETVASIRPGDAVVIVDVDHFKQLNDTRGHDHGDRVLTELAQCLQGAGRQHDIITRLGGDEFAIVLRDAHTHGTTAYLHRLATHWHANGTAATYSAGSATHHTTNSIADTIRHADQALYDTKRSRRTPP